MKIKFMLPVIAIVGSLFASCSKDATTSVTTNDSVTVLSGDSAYDADPNDAQVRFFIYNSSHQLVKVNYRYGLYHAGYDAYDSIYYNGAYAVKVLSYQTGSGSVPTDTTSFYYTGSKLDSTNESGIQNSAPYSVSQIFHYVGSATKPDSLHTATYIAPSGGGGGGGPQDIGHIVYSGNNVSTALAYMSGVGIPVIFTVNTTAPNPYYGLVFKGSDDIIVLFDQNNVTSIDAPSIPQNFYSQSYTYANGRVNTILNGNATVTTQLSYTKVP